jgi:1-acyl-sn-glycerol-3-phosphate acyltransferase
MTQMRRLADTTMGAFASLLVRIFFRRIEVEGADNIPPSTPIVLVANHLNGLVDGLLLMASLRRYPRFLGKSTLFSILPLWPLLKLAGVVPVYRAQDHVGTDRNAATFKTCRQLLAHRGMVALFPEGVSHNELELQPLKTGASRIALGAAVDDGVGDLVVLPVGLAYDEKARFRSRALVRVGAPFAVSRFAEDYRLDDHRAVLNLTAEINLQLNTVSPVYGSWIQARTLGEIAEVVARPLDSAAPVDVALADRERLAKGLTAIAAAGQHDDHLAAIRRAFDAYAWDLDLVGLTDAQVAASYRGKRIRLVFAWSVLKVLLALPLAVLGALIHLVPYQAMKRVAKLPTNEGVKATVKLLGCFASFTLLYAGLGVLFAQLFGVGPGVLAAVAGPASGYFTVRFSERLKRLGGALSGYRAAARRAALSTVREHRAEVVTTGRGLLDLAP